MDTPPRSCVLGKHGCCSIAGAGWSQLKYCHKIGVSLSVPSPPIHDLRTAFSPLLQGETLSDLCDSQEELETLHKLSRVCYAGNLGWPLN